MGDEDGDVNSRKCKKSGKGKLLQKIKVEQEDHVETDGEFFQADIKPCVDVKMEETSSKETVSPKKLKKETRKPKSYFIKTKKRKRSKIKADEQFDVVNADDSEENKSYKCRHCTFTSDKLKSIRRHITDFHGNKSYPCKECDHVAQNRMLLIAHCKSEHPKRIKCDICELVFSRQ